MKIYDIDHAILDCVDLETGEIIDIERIEQLNLERETKIDNLACWVKALNAEAEAIKVEIDTLSERKKQKENQAANLKSFLAKTLDGVKFETARNKISWRKSESIEIVNESDIDAAYKSTVSEVKIDKTAIKEALKAGNTVKGAELVKKNNIQIK